MPEGGKALASARGASAADVVAASGLPVAPPGPIGPYTVGVEILPNSQLFVCKQMFLFTFILPLPLPAISARPCQISFMCFFESGLCSLFVLTTKTTCEKSAASTIVLCESQPPPRGTKLKLSLSQEIPSLLKDQCLYFCVFFSSFLTFIAA